VSGVAGPRGASVDLPLLIDASRLTRINGVEDGILLPGGITAGKHDIIAAARN
jgi:hypothetical protein